MKNGLIAGSFVQKMIEKNLGSISKRHKANIGVEKIYSLNAGITRGFVVEARPLQKSRRCACIVTFLYRTF